MIENRNNILVSILLSSILLLTLVSTDAVYSKKIVPSDDYGVLENNYVTSKTVIYTPSQDTSVSECYPSYSYGSSQVIFSGYYGSGDEEENDRYYRYAYIRFSFNKIPANDIKYAKLVLYLCKSMTLFEPGTTKKVFDVYCTTTYWSESTTWYNRPKIHGIYGKFTVFASDPDKKSYSVDLTVLIKKWLSFATNYGIAICSKYSSEHAIVSWYSSEVNNVAYRPKLIISYKYGPEIELIPSSTSGYQSTTIKITVKVYSRGGFYGKVCFHASIPQGYTCSFSPSSLIISSKESPKFTTLKVSIPSSAAAGTTTIKVRAESGNYYSYSLLKIKVLPYGFTFTATPLSVSVNQGKSCTITLKVTKIGAYNKKVSFSAVKVPSGITVTFNPATLTPTGSATASIKASYTVKPGTYSINILAKGADGKSSYVIIKVAVKPALFDYSLSVSPSSVKIVKGKSATVTINAVLKKGSPEVVYLSAQSVPKGISCSFSPEEIKPTASSKLTITVDSNCPSKVYTIVILGSSESELEKSAKLTIEVINRIIPVSPPQCIIATVTYGSELADEVQVLRGFRDNIMMKTYQGSSFFKSFNAFYYSWSPNIAYWIQENPWVKPLFKALIYPLVGILLFSVFIVSPIMNMHPDVAVYMAETIISLLVGFIYCGLPLSFTLRSKSKYFRRKISAAMGLMSLATLLACIILQITELSDALSITSFLYVLMNIIFSLYSTPLLVRKINEKLLRIK